MIKTMHIKKALLFVLLCASIASNAAENATPPDVAQLLQKDKWGGADYAVVLKSVQDKAMVVPQFSDPAGAKILAKLTSVGNIAFCTEKSSVLGERFLALGPIATNLGRLQMEYVQHLIRTEKNLANEMTALNVFALEISGCSGDLVSELQEAMMPGGGFTPNQRNGVKDICGGTEQILLGVEASMYDRVYMSQKNSAAHLDAVARTLPRVARCLSKEFAVQMSQRLNKRAGFFKSDKESADLKKVLSVLSDVERERFQPYLAGQ